MDAMEAKIAEIIATEMSWETMRPIQVRLYRETLTQEEVDGLIAFYQSPAGTAYIEKMPLIQQKSMQLLQERMLPMKAKLDAALEEMKVQMKTAN